MPALRPVLAAGALLSPAWRSAVRAEGVEDPATLELVRELGADLAQGYFVGPPAAATAFVGVTGEWKAA